MNLPKIIKENNCFYLSQEIGGLVGYDLAKTIVNFCDKETKNLEKEIDRAIIDILNKNGINIQNTKKSVLNKAFATLKSKGKWVVIEDLYKNANLYRAELIKVSPYFHIILDKGENTLECGVMITEINL